MRTIFINKTRKNVIHVQIDYCTAMAGFRSPK